MVFRLLDNSYTLNCKCKSFIKLTPYSTSRIYSTGYSGGKGYGGGDNERQGLEQTWRLNTLCTKGTRRPNH